MHRILNDRSLPSLVLYIFLTTIMHFSWYIELALQFLYTCEYLLLDILMEKNGEINVGIV